MIRRIAVGATIGLLISSQALAAGAQLGGVQGSVLVNQNGRYVPVTASTPLKSGDRIMSMDGSATVTYADGCKVTVGARSMATVGSSSPCGAASSGVVRAASGDGYDDREGAGFWGSKDLLLWGVFGVVTGAAVAQAVHKDNTPTSP